jgi:hypothetical protein
MCALASGSNGYPARLEGIMITAGPEHRTAVDVLARQARTPNKMAALTGNLCETSLASAKQRIATSAKVVGAYWAFGRAGFLRNEGYGARLIIAAFRAGYRVDTAFRRRAEPVAAAPRENVDYKACFN